MYLGQSSLKHKIEVNLDFATLDPVRIGLTFFGVQYVSTKTIDQFGCHLKIQTKTLDLSTRH